MELEIRGVRDVDLIVKEEESFGVDGPMWGQGVKLGGCNWIAMRSDSYLVDPASSHMLVSKSRVTSGCRSGASQCP